MMRLAEIEAHIASMHELRNIVAAMRSLAGMRMQEAQNALAGIRSFAEAVAEGIADTRLLVASGHSAPPNVNTHRVVVLFAAEHGFIGGFNERLIEAAKQTIQKGDLLFVLGSRGAALATDRGHAPAWIQPMATRPATAPETARRLSSELYRRIARGEVGYVEVIFGRHDRGGVATVERRSLLPVDVSAGTARPLRHAPLHNLEPRILYERLLAEYVFALLTEATVEAIAAENAARLVAMGAAHENVSRKLDALYRDARYARQTEITTEVLDIVTGAEAQMGS
jgi:F-type H+-transporting ATPase subunit gamma